MYKLYKREADRIRYHEAWDEEDCVIEHFGVVGKPGETRRHEVESGADPDTLLESLLRPVARQGYEEVEDDELVRVEVVLPTTGQGDLDRRHALEDQLDDLLGETGLGHCDGGRMDDSEMAAFCFVIDPGTARAVIAEDLENSTFSDFRLPQMELSPDPR